MDNFNWSAIWKVITELTSVITAIVGAYIACRLYQLSKKVREDGLEKIRVGIVRSKGMYDQGDEMSSVEVSIMSACNQPIFLKRVTCFMPESEKTDLLWYDHLFDSRVPQFKELRFLGDIVLKIVTIDGVELILTSNKTKKRAMQTFVLEP